MNITATAPINQLLTTEQVADRLSLSKSTVRNLLADGQLVEVRIGRSLRVTSDSVDEFITKHIQ